MCTPLSTSLATGLGYALLVGPLGYGKTTILQQAIAECGSGILHVPVNHDRDVSDSLYSALKISKFCESALHSYVRVPSRSCPDEPSSRFKYALEILKETATKMFEDKYLPSVMFDNTEQLELSRAHTPRACTSTVTLS